MGAAFLDAEFQMRMLADGRGVIVNCESNRRLAAAAFAEDGFDCMSPALCGFLFLYGALEPGSQAFIDVEVVTGVLNAGFCRGKPGCYVRAMAMRLKTVRPDAFRVIAGDTASFALPPRFSADDRLNLGLPAAP
jgi:hypothetical protein